MSTKESRWREVVDLWEANQLLKYIPEAEPTLNLYDNMCTDDAQEYYFLFAHNYKNKDDLGNTTHKYDTIQGQQQ